MYEDNWKVDVFQGTVLMSTSTDLYVYLETRHDVEHLDRVFPYNESSPEEQPKARLELLTWWKVERLVEDYLWFMING